MFLLGYWCNRNRDISPTLNCGRKSPLESNIHVKALDLLLAFGHIARPRKSGFGAMSDKQLYAFWRRDNLMRRLVIGCVLSEISCVATLRTV